MKTIDLHVHSYYSDGEKSPKSLLATAIGKGLSAFSITDHNYISPEQKYIQKIADKRGILFIQGIEVSCIDKKTDTSLHILGYSRSFNIERINKKMLPLIKGYNDRAKKIIEKLNHKYATSFKFKKIKNEIPGIYISRNYLAQKLSKFLGDKLTSKELLSKVFIKEDDSWMFDVREAIKIIKESNGFAILAHPGNIVNSNQFDNLIKKLVGLGLDGIEVYTPEHTIGIINILRNIAEKYNLISTAGSDWHGEHISKEKEGVSIPNKIHDKLLETFKYKESHIKNKRYIRRT